MKSKLLFITIFLLTFVFGCSSTKVVKYDWNYMNETLTPSWVENGPEFDPNYFVGIGMSHKSRQGPQYQLDLAYQSAVDDLARSVQAKVETELNTYVSSSNGSINRLDVVKYSRHYTKVLLRNVARKKQWIDKKSSAVWVMVIVPRDDIKRLIELQAKEREKLNKVKMMMAVAQNKSRTFAEREYNANLVFFSLYKVNFDVLFFSDEKDNSLQYYKNRCSLILSEVEEEHQARIDRSKMIYEKSFVYLHRAENSMENLYVAQENIDIVMKYRDELNNDIECFHGDLERLNNKIDEVTGIFNRESRFVNFLRIGMPSSEVENVYDSPEIKREERLGSDTAWKYGYYWLIFTNNILDCVVKEADFLPYGSDSLYDCEEHLDRGVHLFRN